ncbi:pilus assembly protein TadG-related protein [Thermomicrobiaceae bacterium CFH 74404]|uniref:Pilus assembly protein TadG-related protein n=1 Tax=Thermalbibacter longus TaxID=2951981 RepID=A0AA41WAZ9_9BACT|nr:pilus assembly protein TadG-related protein [Thermalbibacter longus]MCM8749599.1 pilus assembly protein TadG-related protein [Thermalbibacter longus]
MRASIVASTRGRLLAAAGRHAGTGQVMVLFALMLTVLVGFLGLAIDAGFLLAERRAVQNAADASALYGGRLLSQGKSRAQAEAGALDYAAQIYGYASSDPDVQIEAEATSTQVRVEITRELPRFFLGVLYTGDWSVHANAVTSINPETGPYAMIALGKLPDYNGIDFNGNNTLTITCSPPAPGCGSIGSNADITFSGSGSSIQATVWGNLGAMGNIEELPTGFHVEGDVAGGQGEIEDPFAAVSAPDCDSMPVQQPPSGPPNEPVVLEPGRYTGNVRKRNITLLPGVYCFEGTLEIIGNGSISGNGVLLYFRGPNGLFVPGNATIELTHTSDPAWKNIVIWLATCNESLKLDGNGDMVITGAVYAPCSHVDLGGNADSQVVNGMVVGRTIKLHGDVTINLVTGSSYTAGPKQVYLIE